MTSGGGPVVGKWPRISSRVDDGAFVGGGQEQKSRQKAKKARSFLGAEQRMTSARADQSPTSVR